MPLLQDETLIAGKIESVEGTEEVLTNADVVDIKEPSFSPEINMVARDLLRGTLSKAKSLPGKRQGTIGFMVEVKGSGAAGTAPSWGKFLRACGFSEVVTGGVSVVYQPSSSSIPSLTIAAYMDGVIKKIWGARGTVKFTFVAGEIATMEFTFTGADWDVVDGVMLTGHTFMSTEPPVLLNTSVSIDGGYAAILENLDFDMQNSVNNRVSMAASSGNLSALITERRPIGSMDPEDDLVATHDFYVRWKAGTEAALALTVGSTAGNIIDFDIQKAAYANLQGADRNKLRTLAADFEINMDSDAGDDELVITLT